APRQRRPGSRPRRLHFCPQAIASVPSSLNQPTPSGGGRTARCPMRRPVSERLLASLDCRAAFGGSQRRGKGTIEDALHPLLRLCEERSDEAIQGGRAPEAAISDGKALAAAASAL